jgi:hypothetical protein
MAEMEEGLASIFGILALIPTGKAIVSVEGRPLVTVDADRKMVDLEVAGIKESGVRLADFIRPGAGPGRAFESVRAGGTLSRLGWKLNLYAGEDRILSMGSGVSRLTGHVSVNPRGLKKLLKALS